MNPNSEKPEPPPTGDATPPAPKIPRSARREQAARDALRTFIRDMHEERFGAVAPRSGELDLVLRLKAKPESDWELQFDPPLGEQLDAQIEDAQAEWNAYRKGHVYCFRCDSSECDHSLPPSPLAVFGGYAPNGLPEWVDFAQVLIAAKDDRVDRLFADSPDLLARVQLGHDLKVRQLGSFGRASKTYAILGQVVAGYFLLKVTGEAAERLAVTLQVVEVRGEKGALSLCLNAVSGVPGAADLAELLASGWQPGLYRAHESACHEIKGIEERVRASRAQGDAEKARETLREIPGVLRRLAESIERDYRQGARRTRHVETRRGQRPVHKALEDALAAEPQRFFHDEKAGTAIACGPQGRAHVFNADGRHVTSFALQPKAIDFRLRTRRWRMMTPAEAKEFKEKVRRFIPSGGEG